MAREVKNSRVIVTGGAQGIGRGTCRELLLKGAKALAILDKNEALGTETAKAFNDEFGQGRVFFFPTDVSVSSQFERSFQAAVKQLGGLDILINNAGMLNDTEWSKEVDLNVKGVIQGTLMALETIGKHKGGKGGTVVNVSSIGGLNAHKYTPIYCGTKFAVVGVSKGISQSFDKTGVAIKVICPGAVETNLVSLKEGTFATFLDHKESVEFITGWPSTKPELMGKDIVRLIEEGENGDVWLAQPGIPTSRMDFPDYLSYATPI